MRKKRVPMIKLVVPKYGMEQEFEVDHAERILDMGADLNGGWVLPGGSDYEYDEENGLRPKSDKGDSEETR